MDTAISSEAIEIVAKITQGIRQASFQAGSGVYGRIQKFIEGRKSTTGPPWKISNEGLEHLCRSCQGQGASLPSAVGMEQTLIRKRWM